MSLQRTWPPQVNISSFFTKSTSASNIFSYTVGFVVAIQVVVIIRGIRILCVEVWVKLCVKLC